MRKPRPSPRHGADAPAPPGLHGEYFGPEGMFFADAADEAWLDALEQGPLRVYSHARCGGELFVAHGTNKGFAFGPVLEC